LNLSSFKTTPSFLKAAAGALFISATVCMLFVTRRGIGFYSDSDLYIQMARNFYRGLGFTTFDGEGPIVPVIDYPPFFSFLLSISQWFGADPLPGARWLNSILFGMNLCLVGWIIYRGTYKSLPAAFLGMLFLFSSEDILQIHSMVWSEPAFIMLTFSGLLLLSNYLNRPSLLLLVSSAAALALSALTRYVGVAGIAAAAIGILLLSSKNLPQRLKHCFLFLMISGIPVILWMGRNIRGTGQSTGRRFMIHPQITLPMLRSIQRTISMWLLQGPVRGDVLIGVAGTAGIGIIIWLALPRQDRQASLLTKDIALQLLFMTSYGAVVLASQVFLQNDLLLDCPRILSPLHVSAIICLACLASSLARSAFLAFKARIAAWTVCLMMGGLFLWRGGQWVYETQKDGQGYASQRWKQSSVIELVKGLPRQLQVYSNAPYPILVYADRGCSLLPIKASLNTGGINPAYLEEMGDLKEEFHKGHAVLIYFKSSNDSEAVPSLSEVKKLIPLETMSQATDEGAYRGAH